MYYLELCLKPSRVWCLKLIKQLNLFLQIIDLYISLATGNQLIQCIMNEYILILEKGEREGKGGEESRKKGG